MGLVRIPDRNRPLGRRRHRWEDIKIDFLEIGLGAIDWIHLAE
jgi:hypothetical protein